MFSLREELVKRLSINGFCDDMRVQKSLTDAYAFCQRNRLVSVRVWLDKQPIACG